MNNQIKSIQSETSTVIDGAGESDISDSDAVSSEDSSNDSVEADARLQQLYESLSGDEMNRDSSLTPSSSNSFVTVLMEIGEIHIEKGQYDKSELAFAMAVTQLRTSIGTSSYSEVRLESSLRSLAHANYQNQKYRESMEFFIEAERVRRRGTLQYLPSTDSRYVQSREDRSLLRQDIESFRGMGLAHTGLNEFDKALESFDAALQGYEFELGGRNNTYVVETLKHIGVVYELINQKDKAMTTYHEALKILEDSANRSQHEETISSLSEHILSLHQTL